MSHGIGGSGQQAGRMVRRLILCSAISAVCVISRPAIAQPAQPTAQPTAAPAAQPAAAATTSESRFSRGAEAELTFQQGLLHYTNKQLAQSETEFGEVVKADSADAEADYYLGLSQLDQNKPQQAVPNFDQSLRLDPARDEVRAARATANIRLHNFAAADTDLNRLTDPKWKSLVHYLRGQSLYAQGNLEGAAKEFSASKAAGGTEATPAGFYEGLTYLRMRELVRARGAFRDSELEPDRDPTVAAASRQLDAVLAQQQGRTRPWEAQVTLSYEYDSNVIQLGTNSPLPSGISDQRDSRIVVQPRGSYSLLHTDRMDAGVEAAGYFAYQFDLNDFDTYSYQIGPFVNYRLTQNLYASARYAFNYIELGHDPYLSRNIVTPQLTYVEPKFGYTSAYYQFQERQFSDTFTSTTDKDHFDRDGHTNSLGIVQGITLPEIFKGAGAANLELNYRLEDQETRGSDFDGIFNEVGATIYTPLPFWKLRADLGVSYEIDNYSHGNSLDVPATGDLRNKDRLDTELDITAGVTRQLFKNCALRVDYEFTNHNSNVNDLGTSVFDYNRHQVGVRLIYTF